MEALPAEHLLRLTCRPNHEGLTDIAEDRGGRTKAAVRRLRSGDPVHSGFQSRELRSVTIDERGSEAGHGACPSNHCHACRFRVVVELADRPDKLSRIGQVQIVRSCRNGRARDAVVLRLKGTGRVNDDIRAELPQPHVEVSIDVHDAA